MLPTVSHFKQLCNKSQEQVPVAVCVLPLGPNCPYYQLTTARILLYEANELICHRLYDRYSLTPCHTVVIFVALLTRGVKASPEVYWSGYALGFRGFPLGTANRNLATALARGQ